MNRDSLITIVTIVGAVLVFALICIAFVTDGDHRRHNDEQITECRALGGFAQTSIDGWLVSCTFPRR